MKKRVFILQDNERACKDLKEKFVGTEFEVVGCSTDGISALASVAELKPDILLTELVLSGYDGMAVIDKVKSANRYVRVVVVSALSGEEVINRAVRLGADYFMAKPVNFPFLLERLREIGDGKTANGRFRETADALHKPSLEEKVSKIFINIGIPAHIKGYNFLREGVMMTVETPSVINSITKELYPRIGKKFNTTASKVERAIRHAIEVAWSRGRIDNINNILGVRAYVGSEKPTNGEFIALIADKMLLEGA